MKEFMCLIEHQDGSLDRHLVLAESISKIQEKLDDGVVCHVAQDITLSTIDETKQVSRIIEMMISDLEVKLFLQEIFINALYQRLINQ